MSTVAAPAVSKPLDPKPVSDALKRHFDQVAAQVPVNKRGQVQVAVTTEGVEGSIGFKRGPWSAAAYAGKDWDSGWLAGVRGAWTF